jgi:hypothetical protein
MSYCEIHLNSHNCGQQKAGTATDMTTKTPGKPVKKGTRNHLIDTKIHLSLVLGTHNRKRGKVEERDDDEEIFLASGRNSNHVCICVT